MRTKEFLLQYRRAIERIRQLEDRIERLYAEAEVQANAPKPDLVRSSPEHVQDRTGDLAVRIADMTARLSRQRMEAIKLADTVANVIDSVEDPVLSRLLYDRYIGGMDWYEIAIDLHYNANYTRGRLHGTAIQAVREIMQHNATRDCDIS